MILSNVEIHKALDERRLVITPAPFPRTPTVASPHCPYDTHSVDLRLASEIVVPIQGSFTYDVTRTGLASTIQRNSERHLLKPNQPYQLEPQTFILARTIERVELPILANCETCLAARIEGKSSRARVGLLVHFTAPTVHPGFKGTLTLEMINLGANPVLLVPEMAIAQLIIEEVKGCPNLNPSQFQGQSTPEGTS